MKSNPKAPTVTVREVTEADVPPIPDKVAIHAWLDSNGTNGPQPLGTGAGHYQRIVLNTVTGELSFHCSDYRRSDRDKDYYPGALFAPSHWQGVPRALYWVIDSGVDERPYHDVAEGNGFAQELAPLAQRLLDTLLPVPGTDELDWSAEAASAGLDIDQACHRSRKAPEGRRPWLIDLADAVGPFPDLVSPSLADASDEILDEEAGYLSRMDLIPAGAPFPNLAEYYEISEEDAHRYHAGLVGTRAHLYQYRADQAAGLRPLDAAHWLVQTRLSLARRVTPDSTDAYLNTLAHEFQQTAASEGVKLIGTARALRDHRARLRQALVDELTLFANARDEAEGALKRYRAAVAGRLAQIISWDDPQHSNNDAELGRKAGISRQAVNKLRGTFEDAENSSIPRDPKELQERITADHSAE
ncbi:hypothetical protein [Streptomyces sp. NPDC053048]|uniref:hypothetical protein n=1 Tax=Streptomyces sp. NPDC053048 TaxID=3365694 RepID=UPI0037D6D4E8